MATENATGSIICTAFVLLSFNEVLQTRDMFTLSDLDESQLTAGDAENSVCPSIKLLDLID